MTLSVRLKTALLLLLVSFSAFTQNSILMATSSTTHKILVTLPSNLYGRTKVGIPVGIVAETVDAVLHRMGYDNYKFINMRTDEAVKALQENKVDIIAVLYKTQKTQNIGMFTDPIIIEYNVIAVRKGDKFQLLKFSDLYEKKLGIRTAHPYKPPTKYDRDIDLQRFESKGDILRSLILGRIDAAIISSLSDIYDFRTEGIMKQLDLLDRAVGTIPIYAMFSTKLFSQQDVQSFNFHLTALQQEPIWTDILSRNGFGDLVHVWPMVSE